MYNRYKVITEKFTELVEKELSTTEDGEPMWTVKVLENDQKTLLPRNVQGAKKNPRLGSFEVILSWKSAGDMSAACVRAPCACFFLARWTKYGSPRAPPCAQAPVLFIPFRA